MAMPYIGEVRWFPYTRVPTNYQLCDGSVLPIANNEALYTLLGTTYGGDGQTTFGVPDLRGRIPIHFGQGTGLSNYTMGQASGTEEVTLTPNQLGGHTHFVIAETGNATAKTVSGNMLATLEGSGEVMYAPTTSGGTASPPSPLSIGQTGSGIAHENCAPTLTLTPCIAIFGIFPTQG